MDPDPQALAPTSPHHEQRGQRFERWMRVVRSRDFARAYREGSRAKGTQLTLVAAPNDLGYSRLGLSIGRRYHRHAVVRNRLRRTVREAFRLEYGDLPRGMDLVAVGSEPGVTPDLVVLRREIVQLAARAVKRLGEPRPPRSAGRHKAKKAGSAGKTGTAAKTGPADQPAAPDTSKPQHQGRVGGPTPDTP